MRFLFEWDADAAYDEVVDGAATSLDVDDALFRFGDGRDEYPLQDFAGPFDFSHGI